MTSKKCCLVGMPFGNDYASSAIRTPGREDVRVHKKEEKEISGEISP